jgi:hypothetical protein
MASAVGFVWMQGHVDDEVEHNNCPLTHVHMNWLTCGTSVCRRVQQSEKQKGRLQAQGRVQCRCDQQMTPSLN